MTQEQWFNRISATMPDYFTNEQAVIFTAHCWALAKCLEARDLHTEELIARTTIGSSPREDLEVRASERGVVVKENMTTQLLREQVRKFSVPSSKPEITEVLNSALGEGATYIQDWFERPETYLNRGIFLNRGFIQTEEVQNTFTVFINQLVHQPTAFVGRCFASRGDVASSMDVPAHVFDNINETVDAMKALGTDFAIIER